MDLKMLKQNTPVVQALASAREISWINPGLECAKEALRKTKLTMEDVKDAQERLQRFAPFIRRVFPETEPENGLIESPLCKIESMKQALNSHCGAALQGDLYLKKDSDLAVAGSVKARGGIYEILKYAEELALHEGILRPGDSYEVFAEDRFRRFFSRYAVHVGSTGNLGLSIGIISAAVGFRVFVHMSQDAKQWKKELLRSRGVEVVEYAGDYGEAVRSGREKAESDPFAYFVDDENSVSLFLGYAVAALRLQKQLTQMGIQADDRHPLFVYIPCGVGGAPGGICFGLKLVFGENVHVFFVEPTQACCMTLGLATGLHNQICVQDIGLTGITEADGLAVGRPSGFVGKEVDHLVSGTFTLEDKKLYYYMKELLDTEQIFIEPSSCAAFAGPSRIEKDPVCRSYLQEHKLLDKRQQISHIVWATGGALVPESVRKEYIEKAETAGAVYF